MNPLTEKHFDFHNRNYDSVKHFVDIYIMVM